MCMTCGCSDATPADHHDHDHDHDHDHHDHDHDHDHHDHAIQTTTIPLERSLLEKNERFAARNRAWLRAHASLAINLMGSPGAGKTALLEALVQHAPDLALLVVEGDQATQRDAERIRRAGCRAIQINTGTGCHLDAQAVGHALESLAPEPGSRIILENVGNLVCPALFDLGESARIVVLSVTEGDDKPLKYPHMFRRCDALILNKTDLLPYVDFEIERATRHARDLKPDVQIFQIAATRNIGLEPVCAWLRALGIAP